MARMKNMTFEAAIEVFDRRNAAGLVPNRKTGGRRRLSEGERKVVLAHTTNAVRAASGATDPLSVELAPYLECLVLAVEADAREHGRSARREASSVRLFLSVVEGQTYTRRRRPIREAILPLFRPLYDALTTLDDANSNRRDPRSRRYPGYLYAFQNFLLLQGVRDPFEMPTVDRLREAARDAGVRSGEVGNWLTAYRTARRAANLLDLPDLAACQADRFRGLVGLPNLRELVAEALQRNGNARAGEGSPIGVSDGLSAFDMNEMDRLCLLAPSIGEATRQYVARLNKSSAWKTQVVRTADCLVSGLIQLGHGHLLPDLDHVDLFEREVVARSAQGTNPSASKLLARRLPAGDDVKVPLIRQYAEWAARKSFEKSPLWLHDAATIPDDDVPWFTDTVFNEMSAIWAVTDFVFGEGMGLPEGGLATQNPTKWADYRAKYETLRRHMKRVNASRQSDGHKDKTLIDFTWAQVVCLGIPALLRVLLPLRESYRRACATRARNCAKAKAAYFRCLKDYMVFVIPLIDGLRIKQYANARVGHNIMVEGTRTASGKWVTVTGCATSFRGYDNEAGLKVRRTGGGAERSRKHSLLPGILDMALLMEYMSEVRVRELVRLGLIKREADYDASTDHYAFFLSVHSTRPHGGYTRPMLSKRFGRVLHWIMRDVLHREVPEWNQLTGDKADSELKRKWRGIFNQHPSRQLIATYYGGIRGEWGRAAWLTNDSILTLQKYYSEIEGLVNEAMKTSGLEHPKYFDRVIDRLWAGDVIDWTTFDPHDLTAYGDPGT